MKTICQISGKNGLWRYDGSVFTKVPQRGVYAVIEDKKENIWTTCEVNPGGDVWALSRYDQKPLDNINPTVTEIGKNSIKLNTDKIFKELNFPISKH